MITKLRNFQDLSYRRREWSLGMRAVLLKALHFVVAEVLFCAVSRIGRALSVIADGSG